MLIFAAINIKNMKKITEFIREELRPSILAAADRAFPELHFQRTKDGWRSSYDLQGQQHRSKDQTVIKNTHGKQAHGLWEQVTGYKDFIDYVMKRDGSSMTGAIETLCQAIELRLPKSYEYDFQECKRKEETNKPLDSLFGEAVNLLRADTDSIAQAANSYLVGRGLTKQEISSMRLGVLNSSIYARINEQLAKRYEGKDYKKDTRLGSKYTIILPPYRDKYGNITGFKVRTTDSLTMPKYLNTSCVERGNTLYALNYSLSKSENTLIVCEGEIDALHAQAKGLRNVAAMTGSDLHAEQIKDAIRKGWRSFILVPDTEIKTGSQMEAIRAKIKRYIETVYGQGALAYVAFLPLENGQTKQDIDSYLCSHTGAELSTIANNAITGCEWLFADMYARAIGKSWQYFDLTGVQDFDKPTPIQRDKILSEAYELFGLIRNFLSPDAYTSFLRLSSKFLGITQADLDKEATRVEERNERNRRKQEISELILSVQKETDTGLALLKMKEGIAKLDRSEAKMKFTGFLSPDTEETIKEEMCNDGDDLRTGYYFDATSDDERELLLPDRAISFVCAPTSHGKSTMLENLALRIVDKYPEKKVLYLTFEESKPSVIANFLSILCAKNGALPSKGRVKSTIKHDLRGDRSFISADAAQRYDDQKRVFFDYLTTMRLNIRYVSFDADTLVSCIKYMEQNGVADVVFIDYVQLISLSSKKNSRQEELKEICLKLHDLAVSKEFGLPIIMAAQFNREVVSPLELLASKIGEAGDLERIADTVLGMWNCGETKPGADRTHTAKQLDEEYQGLSQIDPHKIYAKVLKRRGGERNVKTFLTFDGSTGLIDGGSEPPRERKSYSFLGGNNKDDEPF